MVVKVIAKHKMVQTLLILKWGYNINQGNSLILNKPKEIFKTRTLMTQTKTHAIIK